MKRRRTLHLVCQAHIDPVWLWPVRGRLQRGPDHSPERGRPGGGNPGVQVHPLLRRGLPLDGGDGPAALAIGAQADPGPGAGRRSAARWSSPTAISPPRKASSARASTAAVISSASWGSAPGPAYNVDSFGHAGGLPQILRQSGMEKLRLRAPHGGGHEDASAPFLVGIARRLARPGPAPRPLFPVPTARAPTTSSGTSGKRRRRASPPASTTGSTFSASATTAAARPASTSPASPSCSATRPCPRSNSARRRNISPGCGPPRRSKKSRWSAASSNMPSGAAMRPPAWSRSSTAPRKRRSTWRRRASSRPGRKKNPEPIREAWWQLLFSQFHDILAGTCVAQTLEETRHRFGAALTVAEGNVAPRRLRHGPAG